MRLLFTIVFIAVGALSTRAAAQLKLDFQGQPSTTTINAVVQTEQVRAELLAHAPDGLDPGKPVWLGLQLQHQPEWHTYWKNAGDSGLPTQLQWTLPHGVTAGDIVWPTPQKIAIGRLANFGYEGTVLLPVPLTIAPGFTPTPGSRELEVKLFATWLVCRVECIPQEGSFVLRVPLQGSTAVHGAAFAGARAASPQPLTGGSAQARVDGQALALRVTGLPAAWQGKALNAFVETPELIETAAAPAAGDALSPTTQQWVGGEWSARMPLYAYRSASPRTLPVVLALQDRSSKQEATSPQAATFTSLRVEAPISGTWPAAAPQALVPPALQQALDLNAQAAPAPVYTGGLVWALLAAMLGGLVLNLMPCVLPVLALKVLAFTGEGLHAKASHRVQGLAYTAGVVLSFMALGGLMLALRAGGEQLGWGFQLQSPTVVAALALLFTVLGLNMAGLFEVGTLLPSRWASVQLRHPAVDAFLSGMLAVAIASPCTAPFMGASLGYAISLPGVQALGIFAALGLGLALPYLLVSWVPAVGLWLPRPGVWMVHLRHFMAFLMWATVVWLVWVLGHLSGVDGAGSLLALLLATTLVVWALNLEGRSRWIFATISIAASALLAGAIGKNIVQVQPVPTLTTLPGVDTGNTTSTDGTPWQSWAPERVQTVLAAGKPVFVDFTAAWCITCQYNKQTTLSSPELLADFQARQVTLLRADWTRRDPTITQALAQLGRSGVPVYVLYQRGRAPVVLSEILSVADVRAALATLAP